MKSLHRAKDLALDFCSLRLSSDESTVSIDWVCSLSDSCLPSFWTLVGVLIHNEPSVVDLCNFEFWLSFKLRFFLKASECGFFSSSESADCISEKVRFDPTF